MCKNIHLSQTQKMVKPCKALLYKAEKSKLKLSTPCHSKIIKNRHVESYRNKSRRMKALENTTIII